MPEIRQDQATKRWVIVARERAKRPRDLVSKQPAWIVVAGKLYGFDKPIDGRKLQPFMTKKQVSIPRNLEEPFYDRFLPPLLAMFGEVEAIGFEVRGEELEVTPVLTLSELASVNKGQDLFGKENEAQDTDESGKIFFDLFILLWCTWCHKFHFHIKFTF